MSACGNCFAWNLPLHWPSQSTPHGPGVPLMKFEQWLVFHLHVVIHQAGKWGGQMDEIIAQLNAPKPQEAIANG